MQNKNSAAPVPAATPPKLPNHVPIAYSTRGGYPENVFYGSFAVVDRAGKLVASAGDVETPMFTRSALKPFQALPLASHPSFAQFKLTPQETALLCSSHNGEEMHAAAAQAMLARVSLTEAALQCGSHVPYWYQAKEKRPEEGRRWNSLFHNCSGKHSGMLLYATLLGAARESYLDFDHPVQRAIREAVAYACGVENAASMPWGTDGCSAPNYAVPLAGLARAFAWMTRDDADPKYGNAGSVLFNAMATHPEMVSGEARNDLALARAGRGGGIAERGEGVAECGDWIAKVGADGIQTLASKSRGIGIAAKVSDGNQKALMVAFCAALEQLGMMNDAARAALQDWRTVAIKSIRGVEVGRFEPYVTLKMH
jgi:L-asparaginase II